jgi:hypothetical protein
MPPNHARKPSRLTVDEIRAKIALADANGGVLITGNSAEILMDAWRIAIEHGLCAASPDPAPATTTTTDPQ